MTQITSQFSLHWRIAPSPTRFGEGFFSRSQRFIGITSSSCWVFGFGWPPPFAYTVLFRSMWENSTLPYFIGSLALFEPVPDRLPNCIHNPCNIYAPKNWHLGRGNGHQRLFVKRLLNMTPSTRPSEGRSNRL